MRIDSHQHYWEPRRGDYDWMPKDNPILYRRYGPADLEPSLERCGIDGTVVVQAAESVHETEYMLGLADASDSALAVVGWVNFEDAGDRRQLERLARHPKLAGVRPLIQDIPDVDWMLRGGRAVGLPGHHRRRPCLRRAGLSAAPRQLPHHLPALIRTFAS